MTEKRTLVTVLPFTETHRQTAFEETTDKTKTASNLQTTCIGSCDERLDKKKISENIFKNGNIKPEEDAVLLRQLKRNLMILQIVCAVFGMLMVSTWVTFGLLLQSSIRRHDDMEHIVGTLQISLNSLQTTCAQFESEIHSVGDYMKSVNQSLFSASDDITSGQSLLTIGEKIKTINQSLLSIIGDIKSTNQSLVLSLAQLESDIRSVDDDINTVNQSFAFRISAVEMDIDALQDLSGCCSQNCLNGWMEYETSCYLFSPAPPMNFTDAERYCQQQNGSHLVIIKDEQENNFIKSQLNVFRAEYYWMGLSDEAQEGVWVWIINNELANFTDWGGPEPNGNRSENCGMFAEWDNYSWNDSPCTSNYYPLCELP